MIFLSSLGLHGDSEQSYQINPGIRCFGHDIKRVHGTIQGCKEACDSLPDCAGFVHSDDESRGYCNLKKESCLKHPNFKPGLSMFVKPSNDYLYMYLCRSIFPLAKLPSFGPLAQYVAVSILHIQISLDLS